MISGKPYDWRKTKEPEKPYNFDYSKTLTMKMFLSIPDEQHKKTIVHANFEKALENIKAVDKITLGVPKIIYLVGWQYLGHDSGYPAFFEVNEALKRDCDATARDSLLWLMEEAYKYNTTVSLHINMYDAYKNSPLWELYVEKGLICLDENKNLYKAGFWNGQQAYAISYKREWDCGFAQRRIDKLLELLPIERAGTIHIDAFHCRPDVGHGLTLSDSHEGRLKIIRYFRSKGIDVTSEYLYYDTDEGEPKTEHLVGVVPLAYHLSQSLIDYMSRPASLLCGCDTTHRIKECESKDMYLLFGESIDGESIWLNSKNYKLDFLRDFCTKFLKFRFLNSLERLSATVTPDGVSVNFTKNVATYLGEDRLTINGVTAKAGNELVLPTDWYEKNTAVVYTEKGGQVDWNLSKILGFASTQNIELTELTEDGLSDKKRLLQLNAGMLELDLEPNKPAAFLISRM